MKLIVAIFGLLVLVAGLALAFPPQRDLFTSIDIAAPPARVWDVLSDTAAYSAWSPDMVLKGVLIPGQVIEHDEGQGGDRMVFHPTIVAAIPARELSWLGHIGAPRILDALHYFKLQGVGGQTRFTQASVCAASFSRRSTLINFCPVSRQ